MEMKASRERGRVRKVVPFSPIIDGNTRHRTCEPPPWAQRNEEKADGGKKEGILQENRNIHDTGLGDPNGQQRPRYSKPRHGLSPIRQYDGGDISTSPVKVRRASSEEYKLGTLVLVVPVAELIGLVWSNRGIRPSS